MNYNLILSDNEMQILLNLLDISVRSGGLKVAKDAATIILKLEQAEENANQPELKES